LAAGLPVETFRASRAAAVRDAPSAQGGTAVAPDALVAQAQLLAASELYLVVERQARIRRCLVEPAPDRLPVHDGSNALSVWATTETASFGLAHPEFLEAGLSLEALQDLAAPV
jgi:hypothetical protein